MTELIPAFSSRSMVGIAIETIVVSSRIMKKPRHSAPSAAHGLACLAFIVCFLDEAQWGVSVILEGDSAGTEVFEEPLGPVELEDTAVVGVAPVEPVDRRCPVVGQALQHDPVRGDGRAQPRDPVLQLDY